MFCCLFTLCAYPSQSVDQYTFVHLLKEFPYPALDVLPIYPILFNAHILSYLFMCKYAISAIYLQKYKKYSEKSDYMDGFCLQGELNLPLFYMIEGYFEKPKSLMTLMAVTLMNGKRPKTFICFSDETPSLS